MLFKAKRDWMKEITNGVCADREEVQGLSPGSSKEICKGSRRNDSRGKGDVFIYVYIVK